MKGSNIDYQKTDTKEKKIIFFGNSITQSWSSYTKFFSNNGYINKGISGQTTDQMLLRFKEDVVNEKPQCVVILAGINALAQNNGPISLEEIFENKEQIEVSKFYEKLPKPYAIAIEEWLENKIYFRDTEADTEQ